MALQSKLFSGDPKLEAAADSDTGHIMPGARGEHVRKIQSALIELDGAAIDPDGIFGPATAAAVLAYKQKRDIVNRSYQTQADNIVGRMTMASLDSEMLKHEALPHGHVQIKPLAHSRVRPPRSPILVALLENSRPFEMNVASSQPVGMTVSAHSATVGKPSIQPHPSNSPTGPNAFPWVVVEMRRNSMAQFVVIDGSPGNVVIGDTDIATIAPDALVTPGDRVPVVSDPQTFKIFSGSTLGWTIITATSGGSSAWIEVVVKSFFSTPQYHPGVSHGHTPAGQWAEVQKNPNNSPSMYGTALDFACPKMGPWELAELTKTLVFGDKPNALQHLDWYLTKGRGRDFVEDNHISNWLWQDLGIRRRLKREIFPPGKKPVAEGHFFFNQSEFALEDYQWSFGSIDRVDFEVDFSRDTVRVWFQDRYEWHPVYPFYTQYADDYRRDTNCLHAALVELQSSGAADFWMKGQAEVELPIIAAS